MKEVHSQRLPTTEKADTVREVADAGQVGALKVNSTALLTAAVGDGAAGMTGMPATQVLKVGAWNAVAVDTTHVPSGVAVYGSVPADGPEHVVVLYVVWRANPALTHDSVHDCVPPGATWQPTAKRERERRIQAQYRYR